MLETTERACRKADNDGEDNIVSMLSEREVRLPYKLGN